MSLVESPELVKRQSTNQYPDTFREESDILHEGHPLSSNYLKHKTQPVSSTPGGGRKMSKTKDISKDQETKRRGSKSSNAGRRLSKKAESSDSVGDNQPKSTIYFGNQEERKKNKSKATNRVRTTKYTILTWAPLSLLFQFRRAANIYFLIISILTSMPFSPKSPGSMIGTFAMVLFFTMLKEAYEDYWRYQSDKELNNQVTLFYDHKQKNTTEVKWCDIKVGEIIKVKKDEPIPTDLLLIYAPKDLVFVSTVNLDGETNLKERVLPFDHIHEKNLKKFKGKILCDAPNSNLDYWNGNIFSEQLDKPYNCSIKNVLLRGCTLKNTEYCYGIVLYVGADTKIFLNAKKPKRKVSALMMLMNKMLYTVFAFQVIIIVVFASLSQSWTHENKNYLSYFKMPTKVGVVPWIVQFCTFWVAYSHLIPISLYVIIEMLKLGQARLINKDVKMYFEEDECFASCKNSDLIEELGQVEFVFSDKTGTLTQNKMEFKKCEVNGKVYGQRLRGEVEQIGMCQSTVHYIEKQINSHEKTDEGKALEQYFRFLALCHSVVVDRDPLTQENNYQAASPDELALTLGAKQIGIEIASRSAKGIIIKNLHNKQMESYEVNCEFPFDSDRKRMSVIVTCDGKHTLMTKGADNVMIPRLRISNNKQRMDKLNSDLMTFAKESLRTLVMAQKTLTDEQFVEFLNTLQELKISIAKDKEEKLAEFYDKMEQDLEYVGCSAIEDKLQDYVPETIAKMIEMDIRVWVLTGDKQETAIEIGKSCQLIQQDMEQLILSSRSKNELKQKIDEQLEKRGLTGDWKFKNLEHVEDFRKRNRCQRICIIMNGATITKLFKDEALANKFFKLGLLAQSVICCRLQPKQKSDIVALAKKNGKWITLSIGDGANDVSMIQEAHIGVGIRGKEGTQAHRSADYAISQFYFLQRLLIMHGRLGYRRVSSMICYYFYKNIILVFTEIYFAFFNAYSGQIFFADWLPMLYNAVWTSWPCLFAYILEQDVNEDYALQYPIVYKAGQKGKYFSFKIFWRWIIVSIWHGFCVYFGVTYGLQGPIDDNGRSYSHWFSSTIAFTLVVHIIVYKLFLDTIYWNWIIISACFICFLLYHLVVCLGNINMLAYSFQPQINGEYFLFVQEGKFWILFILLPIITLLPDITYYFIGRVFYPSPVDVVLIKQKEDPLFEYQTPKQKMIKKESFKLRQQHQQNMQEMIKSEDAQDDYISERKVGVPSFLLTANESDFSQHLKTYVLPAFHNKEFGIQSHISITPQPIDEFRAESILEFRCASKKIGEFKERRTGRIATIFRKILSGTNSLRSSEKAQRAVEDSKENEQDAHEIKLSF